MNYRFPTLLVLMTFVPSASQAQDELNSLDEFASAYHVGLDFPKLITPQWVGEEGVDAIVVLAIDDMRDTAKYELYLRPILERLKKIDGRAPVSIMTNRADPNDVQIAKWLKEGLSIEVHTYDHPCPCLQGGDFDKSRRTYEQCVDLLAEIPGSQPVAFRMPCCDSLNTPSPRFWAEIFNRTTDKGNFLSIDTSVFQIFTADDPELPDELVTRPDGGSRFRHYVPFPSFVNTIENYPYPYVIGGKCWQFPCVVPSDWSAQHVQQPNNPETLRDWKRALDATVVKRGTFNLVFHPHGWIRNDQVVELIDYSQQTYGKRVKFLTFREAHDRLNKHLLAGESLRDAKGRDAGIRLIDLNGDDYLDVVSSKTTRVWNNKTRTWRDQPTGFRTVTKNGESVVTAARFGRDEAGKVLAIWQNEDNRLTQTRFQDNSWSAAEGVAIPNASLISNGLDSGLRLRDLDGDGVSELLSNAVPNRADATVAVWQQRDGRWVPIGFSLPTGVRVVDEKGRDAGLRLQDIDGDGLLDALFSDLSGYRLDLLRRDAAGKLAGWTASAQKGSRNDAQEIPVISRGGENNGAWFHSNHLWIQNEQTDQLPNGVDRRSYKQLLGQASDIPPPRSPQLSLQSLHLSIPGRVELVAAEPLIADPVAFDWGADGRLWVAEMADYPLGIDGKGKPGGRVRVLTDTDGDGQYDKSVVFLQGLPFPTGIKVWRKGVIVSTAPDVFYAEDTDGDDQADQREVLFTGFGEGNQQHRVNGLRWGLDNWLYLANGDSGGKIRSTKTDEVLEISGRDVRIRPDTGEMDTVAGQTQSGRNRDDWGNWFGGNNSNPGWHYVLDAEMLRRNPHMPARSLRHNVTSPPGAAPVFPRSRTLTRFNDFNRADRFTSACSHSIYRDDGWLEMRGDFLVCEPVHNLVHRHKLATDGVTFVGSRAPTESDRELLASSDNWFRPVMVRTGPDGAIWVADMYRLVIEHPEWIPQTWQQRLNLRDGDQAGRIYRIVPPEDNRTALGIPKLGEMSPSQLVQQLEHSNGWVRDMAHQLLLWQSDNVDAKKAIGNEVRSLLGKTEHAWARVHAMSVLMGLNSLEPSDLLSQLESKDPRVRAHAIRLGRNQDTNKKYIESFRQVVTKEEDARVQLQLAYALGQNADAASARQLAALAAGSGDDQWLQAAITSSLRPETLSVFSEELQSQLGAETPLALRTTVLRMAAATRNWEVASSWLTLQPKDGPAKRILLQNLAQILQSSRGNVPKESRQSLAAGLSSARAIAQDKSEPSDLRQAALNVLGYMESERANDYQLAEKLLGPAEGPNVQIAGLQLLLRSSREEAAALIFSQWRSLTPRVRDAFVSVVLNDRQMTTALVSRIEDGTVRRSELGARAQQILRESTDESIRKRMAKLWQDGSTRKEVLAKYGTANELVGDLQRGKTLFGKHCANCHRLQDVGHDVAPNLAALTDRSSTALLTAVLDPNRAVEDKYVDYIVTTDDGLTHRGMLGLETDTHVVLIGADGKSTEVPRAELDELISSGRSLMPEGLERQIDVQQMADLISYLQKTRAPHKVFPGNEPKTAPLRDDGSARLLATDCRIYGPTLKFEPQYRNLGFWGSEQDTAVWTVNLPKAGKYRVSLDYACDNGTAGNRYRLEAAGQVLTGEIDGSGTWDNYRSATIGTLELPVGEFEVTLRSDGPMRSYLMDLRGIVLRP